jgi:hypothetical protein
MAESAPASPPATAGPPTKTSPAATLHGPGTDGGELVRFPDNFAEGVLYATVKRGDIVEEIFTSRATIDAVRSGQPIPSGTVITLVEYEANRDTSGRLTKGELRRYVVMEKRTGWGARYPPDKRNGEWEYQAFRADRAVNDREDLNRCFACHKSQERRDFVFTLDQMKSAR